MIKIFINIAITESVIFSKCEMECLSLLIVLEIIQENNDVARKFKW